MTATTLDLLHDLHELDRRMTDRAFDAARTLAEDFIGVAVAGSATDAGRIVRDTMQALGRPGPVGVPGTEARFDPATAALCTATAGYSIGLTDTHARSITHPGPTIVPTALAVAEHIGANGRDVLRAIVLGCEAVVRIGAVVNPDHRRRGFHPTATCNGFGAVVAAATLLGADDTVTANALGIVGSMAGGLYEFRHEGSMLMGLHAGWPAHNGILAVELARNGFTGPSTVLEGGEGFFRAFADAIRPELLTVDSDRPGVLEIGLRPYNACRYGHAGVDALREIADEHGAIEPARVRRLVVETHRTAVAQETDPATVIGARLSTAFTVAWALVHGPKIDEVTPEDLRDPAVLAVLERTEVVEDPELTARFPEHWACRVRVRLDDGRELVARVDSPKGEPDNPMTPGDVAAKFHRLTDPVLGPDAAGRAEQAFLDLAHAPDVTELAAALRRPVAQLV